MHSVAPFSLETADRLTFTACIAIVVHLVVILGVGFSAPDSETSRPNYEPMEIVLVERASEQAPDDAQLLAQHNYAGKPGGPDEEGLASLLPVLFPDETPVIAAPPEAQAAPSQSQGVDEEPLTDNFEQLTVPPEAAPEVPAPQSSEQDLDSSAAPVNEPESPVMLSAPSAQELIARSLQIAALASEIKRKLGEKSRRPRRKFVSASTREYIYAAYMESWRHKVELFGNLNYPEDVRRQKLSGSLILEVVLKPDGSVQEIIVRRSSGNPILDNAAVRIVRLASPFASFPKNIRAETDILHITRTWQFRGGWGFR